MAALGLALAGCGSADHAGFVDGMPVAEAGGAAGETLVATGGATGKVTTRALVAGTGGATAAGGATGAGGAGGAAGASTDAGGPPGLVWCGAPPMCPAGFMCVQDNDGAYCRQPCHGPDVPACDGATPYCVAHYGARDLCDAEAAKLGGGVAPFYCSATPAPACPF